MTPRAVRCIVQTHKLARPICFYLSLCPCLMSHCLSWIKVWITGESKISTYEPEPIFTFYFFLTNLWVKWSVTIKIRGVNLVYWNYFCYFLFNKYIYLIQLISWKKKKNKFHRHGVTCSKSQIKEMAKLEKEATSSLSQATFLSYTLKADSVGAATDPAKKHILSSLLYKYGGYVTHLKQRSSRWMELLGKFLKR